MDGVSGTVGLEEDGSPISVSQNTSPTIAITPTGDLCGECPSKSTPLSMPICFLVREQAKSLIAIQELQKRMQQLEGAQNEVISAISDVHSFLSVNGLDCESLSSKNSATGLSPAVQNRFDSKSNISTSPLINRLPNSKLGLSASLSPNINKNAAWKFSFNKPSTPCEVQTQKLQEKLIDGVQVKDSAADSDKQDSGLDSDCRDQGLESNVPQIEITSSLNIYPGSSSSRQNNPDELLDLLDEIGHKSEVLRQHLSSEEQSQMPQLSVEMTKLHHEHLELHRLLCGIKGERDELNSKIFNLESTTDELSSKNRNLQENLMALLVEKHKLEAKLHGFHSASEKNNDSSNAQETSNDSSGSGEVHRHALSKTIAHKVDASAVSAVLKETNVLDLQKQVLTCMMENEILRSKLEQLEQWLSAKEIEKECFEKVAKDEIRELMSENERLRIGYDEQKFECAALKSKVRMLERVLQSVTLENRELNLQLGESFLMRETLSEPNRVERLSSSGSSNGSVRRMSLPAHNRNEHDITVSCAKARLAPNTSSFIDVTIEEPDTSDVEFGTVLDPTFNVSHRRASTPLTLSKKPQMKFSDMVKPSSVKPTTANSSQAIVRKSVSKRLSFSSQKQSQLPSFGTLMRNTSSSSGEVANTCDKFSRTLDQYGTRTLDLIHEKPSDPKTFPFYSILEKLKSNSDYKFQERNCERDVENCVNENMAAASSSLGNGNPKKTSGQKCNGSGKSAQEGPQMQTKDRRSNSAHTKNIHKRIQDILDRITSESEEAVV